MWWKTHFGFHLWLVHFTAEQHAKSRAVHFNHMNQRHQLYSCKWTLRLSQQWLRAINFSLLDFPPRLTVIYTARHRFFSSNLLKALSEHSSRSIFSSLSIVCFLSIINKKANIKPWFVIPFASRNFTFSHANDKPIARHSCLLFPGMFTRLTDVHQRAINISQGTVRQLFDQLAL